MDSNWNRIEIKYLDARVAFSLDLLLNLQKEKKKKTSIEYLVPSPRVVRSAASFPAYPRLKKRDQMLQAWEQEEWFRKTTATRTCT